MSLPDFIPLQSVPFAHKGDDGEMYVEINWYLFLYNLWVNVLGSNGAPLPPSVQIALSDDDTEAADTAFLAGRLSNIASIEAFDSDLPSADLLRLRRENENTRALASLDPDFSGADTADLRQRDANVQLLIPDPDIGPSLRDVANALMLAADADPAFQPVQSQPGRLLAVRVLTNGTYTQTAGTNNVYVRFQAPGGAGGGTPATGAGQSASAGGGGAGSYVEAWFPVSALAGQTVNLGTAGTGNSGAAGTAGTAATFGTAINAPGGTGGNAASVLSAPGFTGGSAATAAPTVTGATQVVIAQAGIGGDPGIVFTAGALSMSGRGGASPLTNSSLPTLGNGSHGAFGIGAGGGGANAGASQAAQTGGNAAAGFCEVWEYS